MATARPRHTRLLRDAGLAVGLFGLETLLWLTQPERHWPQAWAVGTGWLALSYLAVALRRVAVHVSVGVLVVQLVGAALSAALPTGGIALMVLTYSVAAARTLRYSVTAAALLWLPPVVLSLTPAGRAAAEPVRLELPTGYFLLYNALLLLLAFFMGRTVYNRRAYVSALEDRAQRAEQDLRVVTERAVADERRRIARELHDVVAHHVSVMGVLATGTRRALRRDPEAAEEALATIEETGRVALREMRRLLRVLRTDAEPAGELEPQPGLPGLEALLEQVREAGLPVALTTAGEPGRLDPGVALAVYRITQEALTNALKHAGPAHADVRLAFAPKELTIEISDTGRGRRPDPAARPGPTRSDTGPDTGPGVGRNAGPDVGHGLLGMRERISLYGGTLRAGPRPGGGFRVSARIPLDGEPGTAMPAGKESQ